MGAALAQRRGNAPSQSDPRSLRLQPIAALLFPLWAGRESSGELKASEEFGACVRREKKKGGGVRGIPRGTKQPYGLVRRFTEFFNKCNSGDNLHYRFPAQLPSGAAALGLCPCRLI